MAESTQIIFSHKEVVEALLKQHGIHEGIWGLFIRFGISATNIGPSPARDIAGGYRPDHGKLDFRNFRKRTISP
jgi:hypothetical protein